MSNNIQRKSISNPRVLNADDDRFIIGRISDKSMLLERKSDRDIYLANYDYSYSINRMPFYKCSPYIKYTDEILGDGIQVLYEEKKYYTLPYIVNLPDDQSNVMIKFMGFLNEPIEGNNNSTQINTNTNANANADNVQSMPIAQRTVQSANIVGMQQMSSIVGLKSLPKKQSTSSPASVPESFIHNFIIPIPSSTSIPPRLASMQPQSASDTIIQNVFSILNSQNDKVMKIREITSIIKSIEDKINARSMVLIEVFKVCNELCHLLLKMEFYEQSTLIANIGLKLPLIDDHRIILQERKNLIIFLTGRKYSQKTYEILEELKYAELSYDKARLICNLSSSLIGERDYLSAYRIIATARSLIASDSSEEATDLKIDLGNQEMDSKNKLKDKIKSEIPTFEKCKKMIYPENIIKELLADAYASPLLKALLSYKLALKFNKKGKFTEAYVNIHQGLKILLELNQDHEYNNEFRQLENLIVKNLVNLETKILDEFKKQSVNQKLDDVKTRVYQEVNSNNKIFIKNALAKYLKSLFITNGALKEIEFLATMMSKIENNYCCESWHLDKICSILQQGNNRLEDAEIAANEALSVFFVENSNKLQVYKFLSQIYPLLLQIKQQELHQLNESIKDSFLADFNPGAEFPFNAISDYDLAESQRIQDEITSMTSKFDDTKKIIANWGKKFSF